MAARATSDVLDDAAQSLREAMEDLKQEPNRVLNSRIAEKVKFALACITAKRMNANVKKLEDIDLG